MSKFRFGVIGFGGRGRHHAKIAEALPGVEARCVAVVDSREPTPEEKAKYGNRFYTDYRNLIAEGKDLDFVFIASPDDYHTQQALDVLEAGIPVYLEKAVATTWEDATRLYQTVVAKNLPLFIGYNLRRFPATVALKQILDQGRIGKVQAILIHTNTGNRWSSQVKDYYAVPPFSNLVLGKLTHDTDTMQHLLNAEAKTAVATTVLNSYSYNPNDGFALGDTWSISGLLSNDVLYNVHLTTTGPDYERRIIVNGSEGQAEAILHTNRPGASNASVTLWRVGEEPQNIPLTGTGEGGHGGADPAIHAEFIQWLMQKPTDPLEPRSVLTGTMVPFAAMESVATGKVVSCEEMLAQALQLSPQADAA